MPKYSFYVYIITNSRKTVLYTGVTNNLKRRMAEHKSGRNPGFTKDYNVNTLVYFKHFTDIRLAITNEKLIKAGSRKKKIALIEGMNKEWKELIPPDK